MSKQSALQRAWLPNASAAIEPLASSVVIVASDDRSRILELMVRMAGAGDVHCVTDARLASSRFAEVNPDLVVIDLGTSHSDGHEVLASLRRVLPAEEFLPVVVVTSHRAAWAPEHVLGAVDVVTKPYDEAELVGRVSNLLRMRGLYRTLKGHDIGRRAGSNAAT